MPVDLPERPEPPPKFVMAAPVLGWLITVAATVVVTTLFRLLEVNDLTLVMSLRLFLTFVGGYSAAYIAGHRELEHAFVMGFLVEISAIAVALQFGRPAGEWDDAVTYIGTIPAAILGGFLRLKAKPRAD